MSSSNKSRGAAPGPRSVLRGHSDIVTALLFLPGGGAETEGDDGRQLLLSASCDGDIVLWDVQIQRQVSVMAGAHGGSVLSLSSLQHCDKSCILSSSRDGTVKVWDLARVTGGKNKNNGSDSNADNHAKPLLTLQTGARHFCNSDTFGASATAQHAHTIATPSQEENSVLLFDARSAEKIATIRGASQGMLSSLALSTLALSTHPSSSSSTEVLLAGYENGSLSAYDLRAPHRQLFLSEPLHSSQLMSIEVSPRGTSVVTTGADTVVSKIKLSISSGSVEPAAAGEGGGGDSSIAISKTVRSTPTVDSATNKTNGMSCARYRRDGKIIVAACWDGSVRLFDGKALRPLALLRHHKESVYAAAFLGGIFATGGKDRTVAIWDVYAESYGM